MNAISCLTLALSLTATPLESADTRTLQPWERARLSKNDAKFLDSLFQIGLFDPKGAYRVSIELPPHWIPKLYFNVAPSGEVQKPIVAEGWLVRRPFGIGDRVYFASGESVLASIGKVERVDFVSEVFRNHLRDDGRRQQYSGLLVVYREPVICIAAWLHRLGHDNLAAYLLRQSHDDEKGDAERSAIRFQLARRLNKIFEQAYSARADGDALVLGRLLQTRFPDCAPTFSQFRSILSDLKRRKAEMRTPPQGRCRFPRWFGFWPVEKRIEFLIRSLDEINGSVNIDLRDGSSQTSTHFIRVHGTSDVQFDERIHALLQIGDAAIPALINAMETDSRLTRLVLQTYDSRGDEDECQAISVRHAAQRAISIILQRQSFQPSPKASSAKAAPGKSTNEIRNYWARYGHLAFEERMMAILKDKNVKASDRREAAGNLAAISREQWSREDLLRRSWSREPKNDDSRTEIPLTPIVRRFRSPTIGEAVLAALDDEFRSTPAKESEEFWDDVTLYYSEIFTSLRDHRIAGDLCRWAEKAEDFRDRFELADICKLLGVNGPMQTIAREIEHGSLWRTRRRLDPSEANSKQSRLFAALALSRLNDADSELGEPCFHAVLDRRHPWHAPIQDYFLDQPDGNPLADCPAFVLEMLRRALADSTPTDRKIYLRGREIQEFDHNDKATYRPLPTDARDPGLWKESVEESRSDQAAYLISEAIVGCPQTHPLRKDRDQTIAKIDELSRRVIGNCRRLESDEVAMLYGIDVRHSRGYSNRTIDFVIADIRPLNRRATPDDVRRGLAIFEQNGQGKAADFKEPVWIYLKSESEQRNPRAGLAVQAEVGPDGKLIYGVIFRHEMRAVKADEVERIEPHKRK